MSAVSLYYYLKVLKYIYVTDPPAGAAPDSHFALHGRRIVLIALSVVLLGCAPDILLRWLIGLGISTRFVTSIRR